MDKFVQAIIIKDSSVLYKARNDENSSSSTLPISSAVLDNETPNQAVEKIIKEQFNAPSEIVFKLGKEVYGNISTFLININNIDFSAEELERRGFKWVSLHDRDSFTYNDKLQLSNLLITCIDNNYSPEWLEALRSLITSDGRLGYLNGVINSKLRNKEHMEMDSHTQRKEKTILICTAFVLAFIYNMFFHGRAYGISYPIFTGIVISVFLWSFRKKIRMAKPVGFFFMSAAFLLSMSFAIHSNRILNFLNIIAVPLLLTASFVIIRYETVQWNSMRFVYSVFERIIPLTFENFLKPALFIKNDLKKMKRGKLNPQTKNILIGLAVSVPLLLIILPLLSSADTIFGYYISNFYTVFTGINVGSTLWNIVRIAVIALYMFGFIWSFRYSFRRDTSPISVNGKIEAITVLTILIVINLVYLLFTLVQFSYLYGGKTALPNGFTYAEYARRGFFELVLVTIINFTLLILSTIYTKKGNPMKMVLNGAYTLLVIFTLNMLFSAHYKISLYESAFGYTYLRIFVHLFLLLLFILFVIVLAGIWYKKLPAAKLSIIAALLMYVFVNFANIDLIIVRENIDRYKSTGKIDVNYFTVLSYDAVPYVLNFMQSNKGNNLAGTKVLDYVTAKKQLLDKDTKWFEFNYSKFIAKKVLNEKI